MDKTETYPVTKERKLHKGIDIGAPLGTQVKAIADGTVVYAGSNDPKGYGTF